MLYHNTFLELFYNNSRMLFLNESIQTQHFLNLIAPLWCSHLKNYTSALLTITPICQHFMHTLFQASVTVKYLLNYSFQAKTLDAFKLELYQCMPKNIFEVPLWMLHSIRKSLNKIICRKQKCKTAFWSTK